MTTDPPGDHRDVQPFLHDLVTCLCAPATVLSAVDGQVRASGAQGLLVADVRHLSELVVAVDGVLPTAIGHQQPSAESAVFVAGVRGLGDLIADPTVRLERRRVASAGRVREAIALVNDGRTAVHAELTVRVACDLAPVGDVMAGRPTSAVPPRSSPGVLAAWDRGSCRTTVSVEPAGTGPGPDAVALADDHVLLTWRLDVPSRARAEVVLVVAASSAAAGDVVFSAPRRRDLWPHRVVVSSHEPALDRLAATGLGDLRALALADGATPGDLFVAAGSPWFLTLFGRDSLWTARFALPLGTGLARGTLRTLAHRQGTRHDQATAEQPGKIPHEVRRVAAGVPGAFAGLPPCYYGTIDATPLWISLLHDAWRWGLPPADVAELLDPLERALAWVTVHGDEDGDGFLEYHDELGQGLASSAFWVGGGGDGDGAFPALALDGGKRPVDALTSNIGHLLGSGLLTAGETSRVAALLGDARLQSGYGLRTLDATHRSFNPLGYHTGSVWPHDTAIAVDRLARAGHAATAAVLATGLVRAGVRFGHRLPELFGGWSPEQGPLLDYPAACRPQAWSAAAVVVLLRAALGLEVDVPAGRLRVAPPPAFSQWFPLQVSGLDIAGHPLAIAIDRDARPTVATTAPLDIETMTP